MADPRVSNELNQTRNMAVFCDFENIALGCRDAKYDKFDIKRLIEHLLLKGSIIVKKAYCDWERYKEYKQPMHETAFELIDIPHVRQSGKNSADIRMVVDALDLCYTKEHVDVFVLISGDSDFSPLVSKLRENNKTVIAVGVKNSTSDLLISNCDEFIFYDDLVREQRKRSTRGSRGGGSTRRRREKAVPSEDVASSDAAVADAPAADAPAVEFKEEDRKQQALDLVMETADAIMGERDVDEKLWGSMVKQALKRRKPGFKESYYGFSTFSELLEEAQQRKLVLLERDEKSGGYIITRLHPPGDADA
jgi:uncharacterized protein (TIGR00288 family)